MIVQAKLSQQRNKKVFDIQKKRKEIVAYLKNNNLEMSKLKMDGIIREENLITAFDILSTILEIMKEKVTYLINSEKCPVDMRASLDTVIFASNRVEIEEFGKIRELITLKYGPLYVNQATNNVDQLVNKQVAEKLSMAPFPEPFIISRIKQVCTEENLDVIFPQEIMPMTLSTESINQGGLNQAQPMTFGFEANNNQKTNLLPTQSYIESPYQNQFQQNQFNQQHFQNNNSQFQNNNQFGTGNSQFYQNTGTTQGQFNDKVQFSSDNNFNNYQNINSYYDPNQFSQTHTQFQPYNNSNTGNTSNINVFQQDVKDPNMNFNNSNQFNQTPNYNNFSGNQLGQSNLGSNQVNQSSIKDPTQQNFNLNNNNQLNQSTYNNQSQNLGNQSNFNINQVNQNQVNLNSQVNQAKTILAIKLTKVKITIIIRLTKVKMNNLCQIIIAD
jgi:hypothetical protein